MRKPPEPYLDAFLRDWGKDLFLLDWSDTEVNAALSYVRKAMERDEALLDAVKQVYSMRKTGNLIPNER